MPDATNMRRNSFWRGLLVAASFLVGMPAQGQEGLSPFPWDTPAPVQPKKRQPPTPKPNAPKRTIQPSTLPSNASGGSAAKRAPVGAAQPSAAIPVPSPAMSGPTAAIKEQMKKLENIAVAHFRQRKYAEALPVMAQLLDLEEHHYGPAHIEVAGTCNNLGLVHQELGDVEQAEQFLLRATRGTDMSSRDNRVRTAIAINNLAEFFRRQRRFAEAKPQFLAAIRLLQSEFLAEGEEQVERLMRELVDNERILTELASKRAELTREIGVEQLESARAQTRYAPESQDRIAKIMHLTRSYEALTHDSSVKQRRSAVAKSDIEQLNSDRKNFLQMRLNELLDQVGCDHAALPIDGPAGGPTRFGRNSFQLVTPVQFWEGMQPSRPLLQVQQRSMPLAPPASPPMLQPSLPMIPLPPAPSPPLPGFTLASPPLMSQLAPLAGGITSDTSLLLHAVVHSLGAMYETQGRLDVAAKLFQFAVANRQVASLIGVGSIEAKHADTAPCTDTSRCMAVPILFGTNRQRIAKGDVFDFSGDRSDTLVFGRAIVTIPSGEARKVGEIRRTSWTDPRGWFQSAVDDPGRYFTVPQSGLRQFSSLAELMAAATERGSEKSATGEHAIVFVHGFNVTFEQGLLRAAQLAGDLSNAREYGSIFLYSWPSAGNPSPSAYQYDLESADQAIPHLVTFLRDVVARSGAKRIHVIAHSMGNVAVLGALQKLAPDGPVEPLFDQIILAAPDIDAGKFRKQIKDIGHIASGLTLYASANDRALMLSGKMRRDYPRAGDVPPVGPVIVSEADTIDVSAISDDIFSLNHAYFADRRELLNDMGLLMQFGIRPPTRRNIFFKRIEQGGGAFWRFRG